MFAAQQGQQRDALYVGGYLCPGQFEERGGVVDVLYHFVHRTPGCESVGQAHHEWCAE